MDANDEGLSGGMSEAGFRAELAKLHRKLAEAKMNNEFLSKATVFFAAKQRERKARTNVAGEDKLQHKHMACLLKVSYSNCHKRINNQQRRASRVDENCNYFNEVDANLFKIWQGSADAYDSPRALR